jgi:hypothetical protein
MIDHTKCDCPVCKCGRKAAPKVVDAEFFEQGAKRRRQEKMDLFWMAAIPFFLMIGAMVSVGILMLLGLWP